MIADDLADAPLQAGADIVDHGLNVGVGPGETKLAFAVSNPSGFGTA